MRKRIKDVVASKPYFCIYCFFFVWMICTTLTEMFFNMSIYAILVSVKLIPDGLLHVPPVLSAAAVFEVIQILGFGSALFAWAETAMKKSILGLTYNSFLPEEFRFSKWILNMHLVATIICIMLSAAGASEGAAVSLLLVYMGFIYLWVIIDNFLLSPQTRKEEAQRKWQKDIQTATTNKNENDLRKYLKILTKELNKSEIEHEEILITCIADAFISYTGIVENYDRKAMRHAINTLSDFWADILSLPQFKHLGCIQNLILHFFQSTKATTKRMALIGCSYTLYLFQHFLNNTGDDQSDTYEKSTMLVRNALFSLEYGLKSQCQENQLANYNYLVKYANATYMAIVWMFFITGGISLSRELIAKVEVSSREHKDFIFSAGCSVFMMDENNTEYNTFLDKFTETCNKFGWN